MDALHWGKDHRACRTVFWNFDAVWFISNVDETSSQTFTFHTSEFIMGLFSNLFGKKATSETPSTGQKPQHGQSGISLMLLFEKVPSFDKEVLEAALQSRFGPVLTSSGLAFSADGGFGKLQFGEDEMMLAQLNIPMPEQVTRPILSVCHFAEVEKQQFYRSQCHFLLSYKGTAATPIDAMDRIYQVISTLIQLDGSAIGVVNESAMTAHPIRMMAEIERERNQLKGPAMPVLTWMAWTGGCVKYVLDANHIWFVTKGNHQFGLPELAYFGGPSEGNSTMELFNPLFSYMYFYQAKLAPGHTADLGKHKLRFSELKEYKDLMEGKLGTLVVNKR